MVGYDPNFLGDKDEDFEVPLPSFGPELDGNILRRDSLRDELYADYIHYTVITHRVQRTPLVAALNIAQNKFKGTDRSRWRIDSRVGNAFQLNNDYYRSNPWDRGHLARRATSAWGNTMREAQVASDQTMFYTNASLQHENFNQDEWLALEDWVKDLKRDRDDKITSFSGPIWFDHPRSITPAGRETALIPAAFYKVICFVNKNDELEVRAFMMTQDAKALADKRGKRMFDFENYQVSVADIEEHTGLIFPEIVGERNPLYYTAGDETRERDHISHTPERIEVSGPEEMIGKDEPRTRFKDDDIDVFIAAALVNPRLNERQNEWVSIINLEVEEVDLDGWTLSDGKRQPLELSGKLGPGESIRVRPLTPLVLANSGGMIQLLDADGDRIDRVRYNRNQGRTEGKAVIFAYRDQ